MIVFIDESGDPGFKTAKGSTRHFVVALVIFDNELDAEETALKVKRLRQSLNKSDRFEFKFNKCNKDLREKFLQEVRNCPFRIRAIVFDKESVYSGHLRSKKEDFYNFALRQVLEHNGSTVINAKVRIDGRGEKQFRQQLTTYLRKSINSDSRRVIDNLRFRDSKTDVLIQTADMVAGSIRRYYDKKSNDWECYRKIIRKREEDVWEFR